MYKSVYQSVKLNGVLLEPIPATRGLKQGCNLSPLLFNLFIEDIDLQFGKQNSKEGGKKFVHSFHRPSKSI